MRKSLVVCAVGVLVGVIIGVGCMDTVADEIQYINVPGVKQQAPIGTAAVIVDDRPLVHTTQLMPTNEQGMVVADGDAAKQVDQVFRNLEGALKEAGASLDHVVKLNVYVKNAAVRDVFSTKLGDRFAQGKLPAVAVSATPLPDPAALIALDAVAAGPKGDRLEKVSRFRQAAMLPRGDVVYVAGQAEKGALPEATRNTLQSLIDTLKHQGLDRSHVVQVKCFMKPMSDAAQVEQEIARFFEGQTPPPVSHVEWISSLPIEIEVVAFAPTTRTARTDGNADRSPSTVTYTTPPGMTSSPVFSRVATLHGPRRIYLSGLVGASDESAEQQVRSIFGALNKILHRTDSDVRHLAKATYYVSTDDASRKLNEVRPSVYDPQRPPAASKAMILNTSFEGVSVTIDMIAAPKK